MEGTIYPKLAKKIQKELIEPIESESLYELLHSYAEQRIITLLRERKQTIAVVELTTCGLISDILTGVSGASKFFIAGVIPYSNQMKIKLGFPQEQLLYNGYGVVSAEAAEVLANGIRNYSGADIGMAETGLIPSTELKNRKTKKVAGDVYCSIKSTEMTRTEKLEINPELQRLEMRLEIAYHVLTRLEQFIAEYDPYK